MWKVQRRATAAMAGRVQGDVAVRRGFGLSAEAAREVGGRHVYFVYFVFIRGFFF